MGRHNCPARPFRGAERESRIGQTGPDRGRSDHRGDPERPMSRPYPLGPRILRELTRARTIWHSRPGLLASHQHRTRRLDAWEATVWRQTAGGPDVGPRAVRRHSSTLRPPAVQTGLTPSKSPPRSPSRRSSVAWLGSTGWSSSRTITGSSSGSGSRGRGRPRSKRCFAFHLRPPRRRLATTLVGAAGIAPEPSTRRTALGPCPFSLLLPFAFGPRHPLARRRDPRERLPARTRARTISPSRSRRG